MFKEIISLALVLSSLNFVYRLKSISLEKNCTLKCLNEIKFVRAKSENIKFKLILNPHTKKFKWNLRLKNLEEKKNLTQHEKEQTSVTIEKHFKMSDDVSQYDIFLFLY